MLTSRGFSMKNKMKEIRKSKGLTQQQLAQKVGVSRQTINAIENSRMNPTLTLAFKLADALEEEYVENIFFRD